MGHHISARCFAYYHIATLAGRSLNNSNTRVHRTCTSAAIAASLHSRDSRKQGTSKSAGHADVFSTGALWHAGAQFRLSISAKRGACTSQPARPPLPLRAFFVIALHSGCHGSRLASSNHGASGYHAVPFNHLHLRARANWCSSRRGWSPAEPQGQISPIGCRKPCSLALPVGTVQPSRP